ncbi:MAG: DUF2167 domain-containing protein [Leptothrix sp. (in: b-proteobacteria)]
MTRGWKKFCWLVLLLCSFSLGAAAAALSEQERQQVFAEADKAAKDGPQDIELAGQALLHLPAKHRFVPQPQATRVLNAMGNPGEDPQLQGLIFPADDAGWFMTVRFEPAGFVKDDDAHDWKADELLQSYRDGTEAANAEREKMGEPALEIIGWAEKPAYDASTHRLVWAMSSRHKGAAADEPQGVNYNTYALGREGYFSLNLITALADLPTHKPAASTLLAALDYQPGKRYADFNASTDHVAEYGLAALVVGVAAKKLGFLAIALAFLLKFAKVGLIAAAAFGGTFVKFFKRRKADTNAPAAPTSASAPAASATTPPGEPPAAG